ncbi:hypothetical protein DNAM_610 [Pseudomonas phage BroderSalsa]|nr:hypothetical protein DNAM_610 [Pseudomonas phage BroderSalsa]
MGLKFRGQVPIKGVDCTIGKIYRRDSQPEKIYLCIRCTAYDKKEIQQGYPQVVYQGRTLASLETGELMTNSTKGSLNSKDFIEVTIDGTYEDVL